MNATHTNARLATRAVAAAACLAALFAGVAACGTEDGSSSKDAPVQGVKAGRTSAELLGAAKARHDAHLRELAAERADALRGGHGQLAHHTRR